MPSPTIPRSAAATYAVLRQIPTVAPAQRAIIELLDSNINAAIAYANAQASAAWAGASSYETMTAIDAVLPAPNTMEGAAANRCYIGAAQSYTVKANALVEATTTLSVFILDAAQKDGAEVAPRWDRGAVVIALLEQFTGGYYDANSRLLWRTLMPQDMTILPEAFGGYSGVSVNYQLWQPPGADSIFWP